MNLGAPVLLPLIVMFPPPSEAIHAQFLRLSSPPISFKTSSWLLRSCFRHPMRPTSRRLPALPYRRETLLDSRSHLGWRDPRISRATGREQTRDLSCGTVSETGGDVGTGTGRSGEEGSLVSGSGEGWGQRRECWLESRRLRNCTKTLIWHCELFIPLANLDHSAMLLGPLKEALRQKNN